LAEVENFLLRDPAAIRDGFAEIWAEAHGEVPPEGTGWDADSIETFIRNYMASKPDAKGSKVLTDLAHELGFDYRKPVHGPAVARHIRPEVISDLRPVFADLFE
jgi:hypothetical protein